MLKIKRRDFIKGTAAVIGAASLSSSPVFNTLQRAIAAPADLGGQSPSLTWVPSNCQGCTSWCAVEVGVQTVAGVSRAVQVRGNQTIMADPAVAGRYTGGFVCPRGILSLQEVYDPDRVKVPMRRTNPEKGRGIDPGFEPITWDEAITDVATRLLTLRGTTALDSLSHTVAVLRGRYTEMNPLIYDNFPKIYGTPNNLSHSTQCAEAEKYNWYNFDGAFAYHDYDIANTKCLLLWGVDPTSSNRQVPAVINAYGDALARADCTVMSVDPNLNSAASKADVWLPVNPGTDGALALAMAHWILNQNLWNTEFVGLTGTVFGTGVAAVPGAEGEKGTSGLITWWDTELKDRTPAWAATVTGISEADIKTAAETFAAAGATAISWVGPGMTMHPRGGYAGWAAAALNALVGSMDHKGGVLPSVGASISPAVKALPTYTGFQDAISTSGAGKKKACFVYTYGVDPEYPTGATVPVNMLGITDGGLGGAKSVGSLADSIIAETPYKTNMIISYWNNYPFSAQGAQRWEEAYAKVYHVHIGTNPCETAWFSDIVLPSNHHIYEGLSYTGTFQRGVAQVSLQQPSITKPWETKDPESEFIWLLAKKMHDLGQPGQPFEGRPGVDLLWNYVTSAGFNDVLPASHPDYVGAASAFTTSDQFRQACVHIRLLGNIAAEADRATEWDRLKAQGSRWAARDDATYFDANGKGPKWLGAAVLGASATGFGTVSKKLELCNDAAGASGAKLKQLLGTHSTQHAKSIEVIMDACNYPMTADGVAANGDKYAWMPHWEAPGHVGDPAEYPFQFIDYKSRLNREGRSANTPWYMEFKGGDPGDERHKDVIKMNPLDMEALGLRDGQSVRIVSPATDNVGERCFVKAFEGVRPGTVAKAYGQGHWAYGRNASALFGEVARGGSNNHILPAQHERLSGSGARNGSVRVKVIPA